MNATLRNLLFFSFVFLFGVFGSNISCSPEQSCGASGCPAGQSCVAGRCQSTVNTKDGGGKETGADAITVDWPGTKRLGELCQDEKECKYTSKGTPRCLEPPGFGSKICTNECQSNADCEGTCDSHPGLTSYCMPKCVTHAMCSSLSHMNICAAEGHCWKKKDLGDTCLSEQECKDDFVCTDPGGLGAKICTKECVKDPDCADKGGKCHILPDRRTYCVFVCKESKDCLLLPSTPVCSTNGFCWKKE